MNTTSEQLVETQLPLSTTPTSDAGPTVPHDSELRHRNEALYRIGLMFKSLPLLLAVRFALVYLAKKILNPNASLNYSQTGEDAIIRSLVDEFWPGIYVDVGCNHPIRWSNTLSLYLHGWRGISIDANPQLVELFQKTRVRDTVVCAAVSDIEQDVVFHEFEDPLVSTLDEKSLAEWQSKWKKRSERIVRTRTLESILNEHLPQGVEIDVLSVDVEGHDLSVLRSMDLSRVRPKLIIVEMHGFDLQRSSESEVACYLLGHEYQQIGFDTLNGYFVDRRSLRGTLRLP